MIATATATLPNTPAPWRRSYFGVLEYRNIEITTGNPVVYGVAVALQAAEDRNKAYLRQEATASARDGRSPG
jgi:hypothetical protein